MSENYPIFILGLAKAGKTSLVRKFNEDVFYENEKPTLATQVVKYLHNKIQLMFYDIGSQKRFRKNWYNKVVEPAIIIYHDCERKPHPLGWG